MLSLLLLVAVAASPSESEDDDIVVIGLSDGEVLRRSAEAVTVVDTERAQEQSADLGEVLARTQGVSVRRTGGLGSSSRVSLAGLSGDQVRFYLDGVPLHLAGYPTGLAAVPVDLVERVEVYRGVVPVRLGADALGGAIQLVSEPPREGLSGSASYQGGSFDTHRVAARLHGLHRGLRIGATAFVDQAANDYAVDVDVPNDVGQLEPARVRRFHDRYTARGATLDVGLVDRAWAERLELRVFGSQVDADIPHNVVMTVPYGDAGYSVDTLGSLLRYEQPFRSGWRVDAYVGATWKATDTLDVGTCVYDWFGRCIRERPLTGEIRTGGIDQQVRDTTAHGRVRVVYQPGTAHRLELATTPVAFTRQGEDRLTEPGLSDPLASQRDLVQLTTGLEHVWTPAPALENRAFVKHYAQAIRSEEPIPGGDQVNRADRDVGRFGVGDGLRLTVADRLWLKSSYEWATRLPSPEEVFGNGVRVVDNLELQPESSHNVNLGATLRLDAPRAGDLVLDVQGFGRFSRDLVVLLGNDLSYSYQNVFAAHSIGVEASGSYTAPGGWLAIDGNTTLMSFRNASDEGTFGSYVGDRIPNTPWWMANGGLHLAREGVASARDRLGLDVYTRWVHSFYRGWESVGLVTFKQEVPDQLSHTVALSYRVQQDPDLGRRTVHGAVEIQNLTDADLFDAFGVQRPGRAVFGKLGVQW